MGLVFNLPWSIAALYAIKDLDSITSSPTGLALFQYHSILLGPDVLCSSPALAILDQALGNKGATTFFTVFLLCEYSSLKTK
jgi:hypothetical protein